MKSNIAIAQDAKKRPILEIADELGLPVESVEPYGRFKATDARVDLGGEIASSERGQLAPVADASVSCHSRFVKNGQRYGFRQE